ncbi:MAG: Polyphosphate kinase 2 [uncultured Acidimicrobiales bacterium]|uniref:Polyphosphate kinase 2 n=1 Tax=uncultured Acidimicrobiales bacterium TaxID=310071 RepID=A0A6J4IU75_9ACTN|nr:MAG: Polyphosphate kinase 2 [uncultured Acidimicrobiales bacterium]
MDIERFRVRPGSPVDLDAIPTRMPAWFKGDKESAKLANERLSQRIAELQTELHATGAAKVLIVLQGLDTSGKDSTTRRVFGAGSPLGIRVANFKRPSENELAHEYLWRVSALTPPDGEIAIFNRSHYEDVLVVRVDELAPEERWRRRFGHIVDFERRLVDEGTVVRKFYLHISHDEQRQRLQDRVDDPQKHWKFEPADLIARAKWDQYRVAYEEMLCLTSTEHAPWYVVPADQKWFRDLVVGTAVVSALEGIDMVWPQPAKGTAGITID